MKNKNSGRERDYYPSKEETLSSTKLKASPPWAGLSTFEATPNREDQNHKRNGDAVSKERDIGSEGRHSKKHKKSKKKKKSKDKDRHRETG